MSQDAPADRDQQAQLTEAAGGEVDWGLQFEPGRVIGDRYQIRSLLGCGGMGEVWHAFDLKLRVEVALKGLRPELLADESRRETLRSEVRAAREVVSPNVCRIFDLIEIDGQELLSMEYVDGTTLLEVMRNGAPFDPAEAQEMASQFLAGLEAIHQVGLVHRDVKPENIMVTRTGRVVLMDFGLARQVSEGSGTVSGTRAYMAPEQASGETADARSDIFSAGVVLAEMVSPGGVKDLDSRKSVWNGLREESIHMADVPWSPIIRRAVARDREKRFGSAHKLNRALEEVAFRVHDEEGLEPYPGLASFRESDAEFFFGREAEIETVWKKLQSTEMLGLIGASGSGKSSFIGAGLVPAKPGGWEILICTPGKEAVASLRQALVPAIEGDSRAIQKLAAGGDASIIEAFSSLRQRVDEVFLIVDQFEELFTQNEPEVQARFAGLLGKLALAADVHILISIRDDFLIQCNRYDELKSIFSELTALDPPHGSALRRAVVQPALKCGYRFEDEELADEILAEVEGERGALPLLAFALAQLWEKRDRDQGLITRRAYLDIGGVGGSLARHAEAAVDRIGSEHIAVVRELFRNLVTAEGTRAAREWNELLSVFDQLQRKSAEGVLRELIDTRLFISYDVREENREPTRRVEIIHESLLANWPRLVRWQTQDADAAQLRDQLRQAARTWDEHERSDDLLWTGSAYREFAVWRERYPGGLTESEEGFARAMNSLATRRRRRRRLAAAAAFVALLVVIGAIGVSRQQAVAEARRAEAAQLVSLGQLELEPYPSATVAYAIASLEQADSSGARHLALKALWKGPTALAATEGMVWRSNFGHDGRWLVQAGLSYVASAESHLRIVRADGTSDFLENAHCETTHAFLTRIRDAGHIVSFASCEDLTWQYVLWSMPDGRPLANVRYKIPATGPGPLLGIAWDTHRDRLVLMALENDRAVVDVLGYDGSVKRLGTLNLLRSNKRKWARNTWIDRDNAHWIAAVVDNEVLVIDIGDDGLSEPRRLGRVDNGVAGASASSIGILGKGRFLAVFLETEVLMFEVGDDRPSEPRRLRPVDGADAGIDIDTLGRFVATSDAEGEIRLWSLTDTSPPVVVQGPPGFPMLFISDDGSLLEAWTMDEKWICWLYSLSGYTPLLLRRFDVGEAGWGGTDWDAAQRQLARWGPDARVVRVWSMDAPADAEPLVLHRGENQQVNAVSFDPRGDWLATADWAGLAFWPLARRYPFVFRWHGEEVSALTFAPDGSWLASSSGDDTVRLWPLDGKPPPPGRTLLKLERDVVGLGGLTASPDGERILAATIGDGTWILRPGGGPPSKLEEIKESYGVSFSADGRLAAASGGVFGVEERVINVWDVASEEEVAVLEVGEMVRFGLQFTPEGHLLSATESGLLRWDVGTGERELLYEGIIFRFTASADGRRVFMVESQEASEDWGRAVLLELDSGTLTRLDRFGEDVYSVALDPTGTFVATGDKDGEVRVGLATGEDPHLFLGHQGMIGAVAIDPLGRWIASGSADTTARLWPMPDLSNPPLHTLPREELIAKLKTLTNLRVVRDPESSTGWKIEVGPFPGWETVPSW